MVNTKPQTLCIIKGKLINSGRIGCELAVLALLCVLTVYFFPAMQGPYSVVHGPATALLAARAAVLSARRHRCGGTLFARRLSVIVNHRSVSDAGYGSRFPHNYLAGMQQHPSLLILLIGSF